MMIDRSIDGCVTWYMEDVELIMRIWWEFNYGGNISRCLEKGDGEKVKLDGEGV